MKVTTEQLAKYVGGQVEIQNSNEEYLFRGEVESISIVERTFRVRFTWLAKGVGFPPFPHHWIKDDNLDYAANLDLYYFSDIGDGRLCLESSIVGETVILFPPDGSRLDPSKVLAG